MWMTCCERVDRIDDIECEHNLSLEAGRPHIGRIGEGYLIWITMIFHWERMSNTKDVMATQQIFSH